MSAKEDFQGDARPPVLVVAGPTASGKSAIALALAEDLRGVIINADSMQIYRELEILTARPGAADLARVPHRLYGILAGTERCSAGRWRDLALEAIQAARAAGRLPILTGGTGLYLRSLQEGLAAIPPIDAAVRAAATARHGALGPEAFHREVAERDPAAAARLHPNDSQRLIRAWEVVEATGRPLSDWQDSPDQAPAPCRFLNIVLQPPRADLYARCDARFDAMLTAGALAEVEALLALRLDPSLPVMKSLGVPDLARHLAGEVSLAEAKEAAQQHTRRYAKRQLTWLRHQVLGNDPNAIVLEKQLSESLLGDLSNKIRQNLLTLP